VTASTQKFLSIYHEKLLITGKLNKLQLSLNILITTHTATQTQLDLGDATVIIITNAHTNPNIITNTSDLNILYNTME